MLSLSALSSVASALEAVPPDYIHWLTVGDLRALVRLGIAQTTGQTTYRPIYDAPRLCGMSKGQHRFVKLLHGEDRMLETFILSPMGLNLLSSIAGIAPPHSPTEAHTGPSETTRV